MVVELGPFDESSKCAVMTITDRGIGMREAVIRHYFLRAGASYRRGGEWQMNFERDGDSPKIIRSGRFGVGALAAFLIGIEVEIETRYITSNEGYSFKTNLETEAIEVKRSEAIQVGTRIKIVMTNAVYEKLLTNTSRRNKPNYWDWYCLSKPTVLRKFQNKIGAEVSEWSNDKVNVSKGNWRKLKSVTDYEVYWTFESAPALTCNGIFVNDEFAMKRMSVEKEYLCRRDLIVLDFIELPNIAIVDTKGLFPLNLKRDSVTLMQYSFIGDLVRDFLNEMLAWLFFNGPTSLNSAQFSNISFKKWLKSDCKNVFIADATGYALKIAILLQDFKMRHRINYEPGFEFTLTNSDTLVSVYSERDGGLTDPFMNGSESFANVTVTSGKNRTHSGVFKRRLIYDNAYGNSNSFLFPDRESILRVGNNERQSTYHEERREGPWIFETSSSTGNVAEFTIKGLPPGCEDN